MAAPRTAPPHAQEDDQDRRHAHYRFHIGGARVGDLVAEADRDQDGPDGGQPSHHGDHVNHDEALNVQTLWFLLSAARLRGPRNARRVG